MGLVWIGHFLCTQSVRSKVPSGDLIADRHPAKTRRKACWTPLHPLSASKCLSPRSLGCFNFFFSKKILIPLAGLGIDPVVLLREDRLPTHGCGFPALPRILRCHTHENKSSIKPTIARSDLENYTGRVIDNLQ